MNVLCGNVFCGVFVLLENQCGILVHVLINLISNTMCVKIFHFELPKMQSQIINNTE